MATLIEILPTEAQKFLAEAYKENVCNKLLHTQIDELTIADFQLAAASLRKALFAYPSDAKKLIDLISDTGNW